VCTYIINIILSYKHILYTEITHTNCLASSLNTFIGKILIPSFGILFACLFINKKLYYNSSLFLNGIMDLTSTGL